MGRSIAEPMTCAANRIAVGRNVRSAPEGSLTWRNLISKPVRFLEGKLADFESRAVPRLRGKSYLYATRLPGAPAIRGRIKYLEEELLRTGGLHPTPSRRRSQPARRRKRPPA